MIGCLCLKTTWLTTSPLKPGLPGTPEPAGTPDSPFVPGEPGKPGSPVSPLSPWAVPGPGGPGGPKGPGGPGTQRRKGWLGKEREEEIDKEEGKHREDEEARGEVKEKNELWETKPKKRWWAVEMYLPYSPSSPGRPGSPRGPETISPITWPAGPGRPGNPGLPEGPNRKKVIIFIFSHSIWRVGFFLVFFSISRWSLSHLSLLSLPLLPWSLDLLGKKHLSLLFVLEFRGHLGALLHSHLETNMKMLSSK